MASPWSVVWVVYYGLPVVSVLMHVGLGYWIYRNHWDQKSTPWFLATLAAGGASALTFWLHMTLPVDFLREPLMKTAGFFSFAAISLWVAFASEYTETYFHRHWIWKITLFALPLGHLGLSATERFHDLYVTQGRIVTEPVTYFAYKPELGLLLLALLAYAVGIYSVYRLTVYLLSTSNRWKHQIGLVVGAAVSVIVISALGNADVFPATDMYYDTYAKIPFILFTALALFRFDLWSVKPVARNTVVETLDDPVIVVDENERIIDVNPASVGMWPDAEARIGDPFTDVCRDLADEISIPADRNRETHVTLERDGQQRHYSVTISAVSRDQRDDENWHSILLRDITALERSRSKLQQQNARLDQVASTISHDLRNPISVVKGRLELLDVHVEDLPVDEDELATVHEDSAEIESATDRMLDIIEDILTIAREGQSVEATEPVSLETLATDAWGHVDQKDATLTVAGDVTFEADRSKVLTILENLFRNALDHGPDDAEIEVGPTDDGFYVQDDGPGVPEVHREDLFEFGYTTSEAGTGLGLSIVRTMAEAHGWTVGYDDEYDDGARFVIGGVAVESAAGSERFDRERN